MSPTAMEIAAPFIGRMEGFYADPYLDTAGVPTIGYGTTRINGAPVTMQTPRCTEAQALAWLEIDMAGAWAAVQRGVTTAAATQHQLAAFISFAYNEGINALLGSALLRLFNLGSIAGCEAQFGEWIYDHDPNTGQLVKVQGLVNRRNAELALFKTPDAAVAAPEPAPAVALFIGMEGEDVKRLQAALLAAGYDPQGTDGWFGADTRTAVKAFQAAHGLAVDGIAGTVTQAALKLT